MTAIFLVLGSVYFVCATFQLAYYVYATERGHVRNKRVLKYHEESAARDKACERAFFEIRRVLDDLFSRVTALEKPESEGA